MKKFYLYLVTLCLTAALVFAGFANAQAGKTSGTQPQVVGVGSSALFQIVTIAMLTNDPLAGSGAYCGTNLYTLGTSNAFGYDQRAASIPPEPGSLAIVWNGDAAGDNFTQVCVYLSVDSVVGQRLFLEQQSSTTFGQTDGFVWITGITTGSGGTAGANKLKPFLLDTTSYLPTSVFNAVQGAYFNVAFTDIRPEDGLYATARAICAEPATDTTKNCMGYAPTGGTYQAVRSAFSGSIANIVPYAVPASSVTGSPSKGSTFSIGGNTYTVGVDPISQLSVPAINTVPIGADPVLVIVNTQGTYGGSFATLFASGVAPNVSSHALSAVYSGQGLHPNGLLGIPAPSGNPTFPILMREPTSGTYNTFEWQAVRSRENLYGNSQELIVPNPTLVSWNTQCFTPPAVFYPASGATALNCDNPLFLGGGIDAYTNVYARAIGTGEMVSSVSSTTDALGYAFWSVATFSGKTAIRYLTVNGVDPLYQGYAVADGGTGGLFPTCAGSYSSGALTYSCTYGSGTTWPAPTFTHVANGDYKIWSTLRAIVYPGGQTYVTPINTTITPIGLIQAAQDQAKSSIPDLVPFQVCKSGNTPGTCSITAGSATLNLTTFRSHYGISGVYPSNGILQYLGAPSPYNQVEGGGDMTGVPLSDYLELDICSTFGFGNDMTAWEQ